MPTGSMRMTEALLSAYRRTVYVMLEPPGFRLRIGQRFDCLEQMGIANLSVITAYNPQSQLLSVIDNEERQTRLRAAVEMLGCRYWQGEGRDESGSWPAEPSLFIADIREKSLRQLMHQFDQLAVVRVAVTGIPRLMLREATTLPIAGLMPTLGKENWPTAN